MAAVKTAIHGTTERRIATVDHFFDVFQFGIAWVKSIFNFFKMVGKDFLENVHNPIMKQSYQKNKLYPSRMRGRGVEVSKTLFYLDHLKEEI